MGDHIKRLGLDQGLDLDSLTYLYEMRAQKHQSVSSTSTSTRYLSRNRNLQERTMQRDTTCFGSQHLKLCGAPAFF
jgi:hypothetical protein